MPWHFKNGQPHAGSGGGWLSYKATKPGLVLFYILACFNRIVAC